MEWKNMEENGERKRKRGKISKEKKVWKSLFTFSFSQTPLHLAVIRGSVECVKLLLQHGAEVSARDVRKLEESE